jgi:hypothetical protein
MSLKNIHTCSDLKKEIEAIAKQRITGKSARGQKQNVISRLKNNSYENVMKIQNNHNGICNDRKRAYKRSFELLNEFFQDNIPPIEMITKENLADFDVWLGKYQFTKSNVTKHYANDTQTDYKSKIGAVIKHAISIGIINVNPLPKGFRGKWVDDAKKDILDEAEFFDFINLDESKLNRNEVIVKLLGIIQGFTSIGIGDLNSMEYSNFKQFQFLDENYNKVTKHYIQKNRNKTDEEFTVFIPEPIKSYLDRLISMIGTNEKPFNLKSDTHINNTYKSLIKKAGINKHITSNNFRHSMACDFIEKIGNYAILDIIMGHKGKENRMTKQYAKVPLKTQCETMENYIGKCRALGKLNIIAKVNSTNSDIRIEPLLKAV